MPEGILHTCPAIGLLELLSVQMMYDDSDNVIEIKGAKYLQVEDG